MNIVALIWATLHRTTAFCCLLLPFHCRSLLFHCLCQEYEMNAIGTTWDLFLNKPYSDGGQSHRRD